VQQQDLLWIWRTHHLYLHQINLFLHPHQKKLIPSQTYTGNNIFTVVMMQFTVFAYMFTVASYNYVV
jgi:hypothetical protein